MMELRLDRLVGRMVMTANHRPLGRIEEIRAEKRGAGCVVTAYVLGPAGLAERLGIGLRLLVGRRQPAGYLARWDQVDIRDVKRPRLLCPVEELLRE
jgi:hypothetical protein